MKFRPLKINLELVVTIGATDTEAGALDDLVRSLRYDLHDVTDGRQTFSTELLYEGLSRLVANGYHRAVTRAQDAKPENNVMVPVGDKGSFANKASLEAEKLAGDVTARVRTNHIKLSIVDATSCEEFGHGRYGEAVCADCGKTVDDY